MTRWARQDLGEKPGYPNWKPIAIRDRVTNVHIATVGNVDRYYENEHEKQAALMLAAPEMHAALIEIRDRLDAWREGESRAQIACEERGDRLSAEGHWNTVQNYAALIGKANEAIREAGQDY